MEKLGKNISKLLNFVLILIFHGKKLKWAYENIWCLGWFLLPFLSLLSQQKSVHCRVVATKFYKTKIPSLKTTQSASTLAVCLLENFDLFMSMQMLINTPPESTHLGQCSKIKTMAMKWIKLKAKLQNFFQLCSK